MVKIEVGLLLLVGFSIWLRVSRVSVGQEAVMVFMFTLAAFYFLNAYQIYQTDHFLIMVVIKVFHLSSSVCVIGILFAILHFTGAGELLLIGGLSLGVAAILLVFRAITHWLPVYLPLLLRLVFIGIFTGNTFFSLSKTLA